MTRGRPAHHISNQTAYAPAACSMRQQRMQIVQDTLMGILVFLGGVSATAWASFLQSARSPFEDAVLGPLGALALAMLVIYGLIRYLSQERKEAKETVARRIADKDSQIQRLREENTRLWGEVQALRDEARGLKR